MKFLILLALVAAASAIPHAAVISTGHSEQHRNQDSHGNYNFGYNENHATGGTFREEKGDGYGNKVGSYGLKDADGRVRTVNYVADAHGFRASISTNEPGTSPKDTAAAAYNGADYGVVAHAPIAHAPIAHAPVAHAAPVIAAAPAYHAPVYAGHAAAPLAYHGGIANYGFALNHGAYAAHGYAAPAYAGHGYAAPAAYAYGAHY